MTTAQRTARLAGLFSRDTVIFVGGWYLIIYQAQFAAKFEPMVFAGGIVLALVPGAAAAWALRQLPALSPTEPPSSQPAPELPSPPS